VDLTLPLAILIISAAMLLANLGNQYLWQDEAQTTLISKTVLAHGVPMGYDGRNFLSQDLGKDCDANGVWKFDSWLIFYLQALFLKVFGFNTFLARLPFALFGIATAFLAYYFTRTVWDSRRAGVAAAVILLLSVPFLLLSRQCRYYSPSMFFSLLAIASYYGILHERRSAPFTFFLAVTLLFHTHLLFYPSILATVLAHSFLFARKRFVTVLVLTAATAAINMPFAVWLYPQCAAASTAYGPGLRGLGALVIGTQYFSSVILRHTFVPHAAILFIAFAMVSRIRSKNMQAASELLVQMMPLIIFSIVHLLLTIGSLATSGRLPFFRYLCPMLPVIAVMAALILDRLFGTCAPIACVAMMPFILTMPVKDYLYEITHDFDGPNEGIITYLLSHASRSDVVVIVGEEMPTKLYTNLRVLGGGTGEDMSAAQEADWVIVRKYAVTPAYQYVLSCIQDYIPTQDFEPIILPYPDTQFENREDPDAHQYRTVEDEDPVIIMRRQR